MNRPAFLDFVASALREAGRPEIARVDVVFAAFDDPSGLRITMTDSDVLLLRVLNTTPRPAGGLGFTPNIRGGESRRR